jgi:hypothetical protein
LRLSGAHTGFVPWICREVTPHFSPIFVVRKSSCRLKGCEKCGVGPRVAIEFL